MDYSFSNFVSTAFAYIITRVFYPKARLIRRPIYIRGKKGIQYGHGLTLGHGCRIGAASDRVTLFIGENARIGDYVHINADYKVIIGNNLLTASKVFISDTSHGMYKGDYQSSPETNPSERELTHDQVIIGDNVWIGENSVILPGSIIGDGCIIGANSLVLKGEYPKGAIIAGSPARIIKSYNTESGKWEKIIERGKVDDK